MKSIVLTLSKMTLFGNTNGHVCIFRKFLRKTFTIVSTLLDFFNAFNTDLINHWIVFVRCQRYMTLNYCLEVDNMSSPIKFQLENWSVFMVVTIIAQSDVLMWLELPRVPWEVNSYHIHEYFKSMLRPPGIDY